jgi:hypothetical protein
LVALACAALAGTAAASADGGHLPGFDFMGKRVGVKKVPFQLRVLLTLKGFGHRPVHGAVWFGEVKRPGGKVMAAGTDRWVCELEEPSGESNGAGTCNTGRAARELEMVTISQHCARHQKIRTLISGLVPNGVTGLAIERADGTAGRTIPVHENTVSFPIGSEDVVLHGVGDAAAERLEKALSLSFHLSRRSCLPGGDYVGGTATPGSPG